MGRSLVELGVKLDVEKPKGVATLLEEVDGRLGRLVICLWEMMLAR